MAKEKEFTIYKITNKINGKIYIGQTRQEFNRRVVGHKNAAKRGKYKFPIYSAMRKYGIENFDFEIIDRCVGQKKADALEIYWIDKLNSQDKLVGYNVLPGGNSREFSDDAMSKIHKGMFLAKPRCTKYKGVLKTDSSFYAQFMFSGERFSDGPFRTEIEAAWAADIITGKNIGSGYEYYKNFPEGKTEELILEQLITEKIKSDIQFAVNNMRIAHRKKYHVHVTNIKTKDKFPIAYGTLEYCTSIVDEYIKTNRAIRMFKGTLSLVNIQKAYEREHGDIRGLVADEELDAALLAQLDSFD